MARRESFRQVQLLQVTRTRGSAGAGGAGEKPPIKFSYLPATFCLEEFQCSYYVRHPHPGPSDIMGAI